MKQPTNSLLDNERALLGTWMMEPEVTLKEVGDMCITSEWFDNSEAITVFEAITRLSAQGKQIDPLAVRDETGYPGQIIERYTDAVMVKGHQRSHALPLQARYIDRQSIKMLRRAKGNPTALLHELEQIAGLLPKNAIDKYAGFTVRSWGEMVSLALPPPKYFLGRIFACGQVQAIFGMGGLGKSRLATNIARNNVLGIPFLDMGTGEPLRHLFIGSENNIHRWQSDAQRMSRGLSKSQSVMLENNIFGTTLEGVEDCFISLSDEAVKDRWRETIRRFRPDVLWVDPWGDVLMGDGFDRDVRETIATLRSLVGQVNPDCGIVILAHARTGAQNIAQAVGWDASNFGKDSKALFSCSRAVINIAPFDESEQPDLVFVNAKNNNGPRLEPMVTTLDPETMTYSFKDWLDADAWRDSVRASMKNKGNGQSGVKFDDDAVLGIAQTARTVSELHEVIKGWGVTKRATDAGIDRLEREKKLVRCKAGSRNKYLIGTPEAIQSFQSEHR